MKALRGLKKRKPIPIQDPQKIAQQKLAILSDQAFIYTSQDNFNSQSWTISSFNMAPRSNHQLVIPEQLQARTMKLKQKTPANLHNKNRPSLSQELLNESRLKRYFRVSEEESIRKNESAFLPERKSLSLTNYILFDKRKPNQPSLTDKKQSANNQFQRIKLLQLKKMIISRRNKRNSNSQQRMNHSQTRHPSPPSNTKIYFSKNYKQLNNPQIINQQQLIMPKRRDGHSTSQAETILQSIIKKKDVPNMNVKKYNKQYQLIRERLEKSRQIQSSINSTKIKLHDYYKKFVY